MSLSSGENFKFSSESDNNLSGESGRNSPMHMNINNDVNKALEKMDEEKIPLIWLVIEGKINELLY